MSRYVTRMIRVFRGKCMQCRLPRVSALFCEAHRAKHAARAAAKWREKHQPVVTP